MFLRRQRGSVFVVVDGLWVRCVRRRVSFALQLSDGVSTRVKHRSRLLYIFRLVWFSVHRIGALVVIVGRWFGATGL